MIFRLLFFFLIFYLVYFLVKQLFLKPYREGYREGGNKQARNAKNGSRSYKPNEKEGDVSILYDPRKEREDGSKTGEYVDYEEVKE